MVILKGFFQDAPSFEKIPAYSFRMRYHASGGIVAEGNPQ
jgi:hypothetical protein